MESRNTSAPVEINHQFPRCPAHNLVTILTELTWLQQMHMIMFNDALSPTYIHFFHKDLSINTVQAVLVHTRGMKPNILLIGKLYRMHPVVYILVILDHLYYDRQHNTFDVNYLYFT
jgi:hypothetical protein